MEVDGDDDGEVGETDGEVGDDEGAVGEFDGELEDGEFDGEVGSDDGEVGETDGALVILSVDVIVHAEGIDTAPLLFAQPPVTVRMLPIPEVGMIVDMSVVLLELLHSPILASNSPPTKS